SAARAMRSLAMCSACRRSAPPWRPGIAPSVADAADSAAAPASSAAACALVLANSPVRLAAIDMKRIALLPDARFRPGSANPISRPEPKPASTIRPGVQAAFQEAFSWRRSAPALRSFASIAFSACSTFLISCSKRISPSPVSVPSGRSDLHPAAVLGRLAGGHARHLLGVLPRRTGRVGIRQEAGQLADAEPRQLPPSGLQPGVLVVAEGHPAADAGHHEAG